MTYGRTVCHNGQFKAASVTLSVCACICFLCRSQGQFKLWGSAAYLTKNYVRCSSTEHCAWDITEMQTPCSFDKGCESSFAAMHLSDGWSMSNTLSSLCNLYAECEVERKYHPFWHQRFCEFVYACRHLGSLVCLSVCQEVLTKVLTQNVWLQRNTLFLSETAAAMMKAPGSRLTQCTRSCQRCCVHTNCTMMYEDMLVTITCTNTASQTVCMSVCMTVSLQRYWLSVNQM